MITLREFARIQNFEILMPAWISRLSEKAREPRETPSTAVRSTIWYGMHNGTDSVFREGLYRIRNKFWTGYLSGAGLKVPSNTREYL